MPKRKFLPEAAPKWNAKRKKKHSAYASPSKRSICSCVTHLKAREPEYYCVADAGKTEVRKTCPLRALSSET